MYLYPSLVSYHALQCLILYSDIINSEYSNMNENSHIIRNNSQTKLFVAKNYIVLLTFLSSNPIFLLQI